MPVLYCIEIKEWLKSFYTYSVYAKRKADIAK